MLRIITLLVILILWAAIPVGAESPSPSASAPARSSSPAAKPTAKPAAKATPTPSPSPSVSPTPSPARAPGHPLTSDELLNSLSGADVQAAISLFKKNFTNAESLDETQLNRATLEGLLARLNNGLALLPAKSASLPDKSVPFYAEILEGHVGYVRLGALSAANLQPLDKKLAEFAAKKVDALVIDLRGSGSGDFATAAEMAKRFVPKGKTLFSLRKQGKQDHAFFSDRDPVYGGLIVGLIDIDTSGPAEAFAVALRADDKALLIGQETAGTAVEYADLPLPSGKILRVAVADCVGAEGRALYPEGTKPDLPVEMSEFDKRQIFQTSASQGMAQFLNEIERPHLNEAALMAGTNPELETSEQHRTRAMIGGVHDSVLQRALDLITSLAIYQKR